MKSQAPLLTLKRSLLVVAVAAAGSALPPVASAQALRPAVATPLSQASAALKAGRAQEALAKVREAEAVGGKTAAEEITIARMKAAAAQRAGATGIAVEALQSIYARGGDKGETAEQIASVYASARNKGAAAEWVEKAKSHGNNSAGVRQLEAYIKSSDSNDPAAVLRDSGAAVAAAEKAGNRPPEDELLRVADAQGKLGQTAAQTATLEKLVNHYPKKDYWAAYLGRIQRKPNFSGRYAIDVLRAKLATGNLTTSAEYMELAQLLLQAKQPAEAIRAMDKGFASNVLGQGPEAERQKRLLDMAKRLEAEGKASLDARTAEANAAKDGNLLVELGPTYVDLGRAAEGAQLIEAGIKKGGLKRPEEAKLRLGEALLATGKDKARALQVLRSVQGSDGAPEAARLAVMRVS